MKSRANSHNPYLLLFSNHFTIIKAMKPLKRMSVTENERKWEEGIYKKRGLRKTELTTKCHSDFFMNCCISCISFSNYLEPCIEWTPVSFVIKLFSFLAIYGVKYYIDLKSFIVSDEIFQYNNTLLSFRKIYFAILMRVSYYLPCYRLEINTL